MTDDDRERSAAANRLFTDALYNARIGVIDDIGMALSRQLAQGSPIDPIDRIIVVNTITRVLDAARKRARLAAGRSEE
jgi:PIN domain nuclease of toxin-antitoxin system